MVLIHNGGEVEELMSFNSKELSKRLYYVRLLPSQKDARGELQFHLEARVKTEIPKEDRSSEINCESPKRLLRVSAGNMLSKMLFEGIHFKMMLDGSIKFIKR